MGLRSKLSFSFAAAFAFVAATSFASAQELESVLKSDTDDLRALIDLGPLDDAEETTATKTKPKTDSSVKAKRKSPATPAPATQATPVQSVLKKNSVVQDSQVKPATFEQEQNEVSSEKLQNRLEKIDVPAPLPTPSSASPIAGANTDNALFDFGVLANNASGGPVIRGVIVGSPAARAGLVAGDQITSIGSKPIGNTGELAASVRQPKPVVVAIQRGGQRRLLRVNPSATTTSPAPIANAFPRYRTLPNNTPPTPAYRAQTKVAPAPAPSPAPQTALSLEPTPTPQPKSVNPLTTPRSTVLAAPAPIETNPSSDVPPPRPQSTAQDIRTQARELIRQQVQRITIPQGQNQPAIVRGQGGDPGQQQRRRPVIGDGGRIIGNGRVINSFRRMFRR